jgi:hypothetical protein
MTPEEHKRYLAGPPAPKGDAEGKTVEKKPKKKAPAVEKGEKSE